MSVLKSIRTSISSKPVRETHDDIEISLNRIDSVLAVIFEHFSSNNGMPVPVRHFESLVDLSQDELKNVRKLVYQLRRDGIEL